MVDVKFSFGKRDFIWMGVLLVVVSFGFVYGYGGSESSVMGHSVDEIDIDGVSLRDYINDVNITLQSEIDDINSIDGVKFVDCYWINRTIPSDFSCKENEVAVQFAQNYQRRNTGANIYYDDYFLVGVRCCKVSLI